MARKWRPQIFNDVVGQEHVVQALGNALDSGRVHHAFLFEGTRGVGKTTIARIFAKALNCEQGVSSNPCGECSACVAVDEGRFVDLLEVDAASRTRVDDTRELLDNVQYAPSMGRYKIYLIDEVHMLSTHSFNALLKTLEEPPEHVKFLLATTDPQKLPVTILSRCLQFGLRALRPQQIEKQLAAILKKEDIKFETEALQLIARAADGSMRDGLSLLDQAIALGKDKVEQESVRSMLGTISGSQLLQLVQALCQNDALAMTRLVNDMVGSSADFAKALNELLVNIYHASLNKASPKAFAALDGNQDAVSALSEQFSAEHLQLLYQIGVLGKRDMHLAPDARTGMEMTLLRMLAFEPGDTQTETAPVVQKTSGAGEADATAEVKVEPAEIEASEETSEKDSVQEPSSQKSPPPAPSVEQSQTITSGALFNGMPWHEMIEQLEVKGLAHELAMHCIFDSYSKDRVKLFINESDQHLVSDSRKEAINTAIEKHIGSDCTVDIEIANVSEESPAQRRQRVEEERLAATKESILASEGVNDLMNEFGASLRESSIQPAAPEK